MKPGSKITSITLIIATIIILSACKKKDHIQDVTPQSSVTGVVTDLNNNPVSNATVKGGTATATTDANGKFSLTKVQFNLDSVVVTATKDGFFDGTKKFGASNNAVSNASIQLIPKSVSGTFTASSGGNVSITGGSAVNFGAGFITASNGNAYSGNVSVSVHYLNPTDQAFSTSAPGNLKSAGNTNQSGALQSFGVIAVEMNDASGNKLQLASGNTAAITIPISSALQNKAPSSIPLWYFDNTNGAWKREGTATKQGNNYVGTVKHFTFWNAGDLAGSVNLTATFIDSINRTPFANRKVTITRSDSTSKSDFTNSSGTISGLVPVNEVLKMQVLDTCGVIVYSKNIGPFGADTILPNINVTAGNCGDSTQYINLTLNGVNYSWYYASTSGSHGDTTTSIIGGRTDSLPYVQGVIWSANTSPGNYTFSLYTIINNTTSYNTYVQDNLNTEVTQYGGVGQYINGSASGWVKNFPVATTDSFPFSINYRVRRIK